jgi:hypothetical protein
MDILSEDYSTEKEVCVLASQDIWLVHIRSSYSDYLHFNGIYKIYYVRCLRYFNAFLKVSINVSIVIQVDIFRNLIQTELFMKKEYIPNETEDYLIERKLTQFLD